MESVRIGRDDPRYDAVVHKHFNKRFGAGATVGDTFRALFQRWGVVIRLGEHPGIGLGGHVPRLQRVKARWDPRNVFRHALSIRTDDR